MRILIGALIVGCAIAAAGCGTTIYDVPGVREIGKLAGHKATPEEQVTAVLNDVARAMEARKIDRIMMHVSPNYGDAEGRNYSAIEEYIREVFRKYRSISITRVAPKVEIQENKAKAIETFGTVAEPHDPAKEPPVNLQGQVAVGLERLDGEWKIVEWGRIM
jgi:hypothetical protein